MPERVHAGRSAFVALPLMFPAAGAVADEQDFSQIERGRYLTIAGTAVPATPFRTAASPLRADGRSRPRSAT